MFHDGADRQTDKQTNKQTDSMTESAQTANTVKMSLPDLYLHRYSLDLNYIENIQDHFLLSLNGLQF